MYTIVWNETLTFWRKEQGYRFQKKMPHWAQLLFGLDSSTVLAQLTTRSEAVNSLSMHLIGYRLSTWLLAIWYIEGLNLQSCHVCLDWQVSLWMTSFGAEKDHSSWSWIKTKEWVTFSQQGLLYQYYNNSQILDWQETDCCLNTGHLHCVQSITMIRFPEQGAQWGFLCVSSYVLSSPPVHLIWFSLHIFFILS